MGAGHADGVGATAAAAGVAAAAAVPAQLQHVFRVTLCMATWLADSDTLARCRLPSPQGRYICYSFPGGLRLLVYSTPMAHD